MPSPQNHRRGNRAVSLLATCLVVLGGAAACAVIVLSSDARGRDSSLGWALGVFGGICIMLWLLRDRRADNSARTRWAWLGRRRRKIAYEIRARLPPSQRSSSPPPAPPSAESVRGISAGTNTWVPSSTAPPNRE